MVPARRKEIHEREDVARTSASSIRGRGRGRIFHSTSTLSARSRGRGIPFAAGNSRITRTGRAPMSQVDQPPPFTMLATLAQAPASPPQQQDETMDDIEDSEAGVDIPMGDYDEDAFSSGNLTGEGYNRLSLHGVKSHQADDYITPNHPFPSTSPPPVDLYDTPSRDEDLFFAIEDELAGGPNDSGIESDAPFTTPPLPSRPSQPPNQSESNSSRSPDLPHHLQSDDFLPGPARIPAVNIPPFSHRVPPLDAYTGSHSKWYVRAVLLLAAFLHTKHHVTFRASNTMLFVLRIIFKSLKLIDPEEDMPVTLNTVLKRFDLQDRFVILPACNLCHQHFPSDTPATFMCPKCDVSLFSTASQNLFQRILGREPAKPPPKRSVPVSPLSEQLKDLMARPGMEQIVEEWRDRPQATDELNCMMDGRVWKTIPGPNGQPFFDRDSLTEDTEIRLGVTFALDW